MNKAPRPSHEECSRRTNLYTPDGRYLFHDAVSGQPKIETHADLIESRAKRRKQLENVLNTARQKLEAHHAGVKRLSDTAVSQFEKKIRAYESQIVELGRELDPEVRGEPAGTSMRR